MSAIPKQTVRFYEFGPFHLDAHERLLFRAEELVPLTPKVLDTLLVLIENRGHLISKDALINAVWPDTYVEECSLAQNISLLRKALGENGNGHQYIETLPRRGYRFTGEVQEVSDDDRSVPLNQETRTTRKPRRAIIAMTAVIVLALAAGFYFFSSRKPANADFTPRSIAVLPFQTIGEEPATEPLGLGMADALVVRIANVEQMTVLPTSSVFKYIKRDSHALNIGQELGVEAIIDGTIQRSGDRLRVTAQVIRVSDGKSLWAGKFDEPHRDFLVIQDSVAEQLVQVLALKVGNKETQNKRPTNSTEAYQLYTMGLYHWNKRTADALFKARDYFSQATEKDPGYALAFARLSDCHMLLAYYNFGNMTIPEAMPQIRAAAMKAVELDPSLSEAQAAMAVVKALEGNFEEAIALYERAIELNPNSEIAHLRYAHLLARLGRLDDAIAHMKKAHELDSLSSTVNVNLSAYSLFKGQPEEAIRFGRLALMTNPQAWQAYINIGEAYESKGMYKDAEAEYRKLEQEGHGFAAKHQLAYLHAVSGNRAEAQRLVAELQKAYFRRQAPRDTPYNVGLAYVAFGQPDDAFAWLDRAVDDQSLVWIDFLYGTKLNPLRQDPRFAALRERLEANQRGPSPSK